MRAFVGSSAALAALVAAAAVLFTALPASAWCQMTTDRRQPAAGECILPDSSSGTYPLEWRRRCLSYAIESAGSRWMGISQIQSIVDASFETWEVVTCDGATTGFDVREHDELSECSEAEYNSDGPNLNTIAFIDTWEEHGYDPQAYALTTVWHNTSNGEIYDADMQINENLGPYVECPLPDGCTEADGSPIPVDLQNVVTHEAGHFFGLAHTPDTANATMYAMSPRGEVFKRILRTDDVQGFCAMYPPGRLPEACDYTPRKGLGLECAGQEGCSCSIPGAKAREGRGALALAGVLVAVGLAAARRRQRRPA